MKLRLQFILSLLLLAQSSSTAEVTRHIGTSERRSPSSPSLLSPTPHHTFWLEGASGEFSASSGPLNWLTVSIEEKHQSCKG